MQIEEPNLEDLVFELKGVSPVTLRGNSNSYLASYRSLLAFFEGLDHIGVDEFIQGTHMVYGWMPTILKLHETEGGTKRASALLEKARSGRMLHEDEVVHLAATVNNSLVGTSKLLHFVAPDRYAIWDSVVCRSLWGPTGLAYRVGRYGYFEAYQELVTDVATHPDAKALHALAENTCGYPVGVRRAVEFLIWLKESQKQLPATKSG